MALTLDNFTQDQIDELNSVLQPELPAEAVSNVHVLFDGGVDDNDTTAPHSAVVTVNLPNVYSGIVINCIENNYIDITLSGLTTTWSSVVNGVLVTLNKISDTQFTASFVAEPTTVPRGYIHGEQSWYLYCYDVAEIISVSVSALTRNLVATDRVVAE